MLPRAKRSAALLDAGGSDGEEQSVDFGVVRNDLFVDIWKRVGWAGSLRIERRKRRMK